LIKISLIAPNIVPNFIGYTILLILTLLISIACYSSELTESDIQEDLARSIDQSIMCPVCPSETIDESQVPIAKQMRDIVREKLALGETKEDILSYFSERYGDAILAKPPAKGFNIIVWIIPPVVIALGIILMLVVIRSMRNTVSEVGNETGDGRSIELEPYLEIVDTNIAKLKREFYDEFGVDRN
tara:strand:+ start:1189 stop:1746 length:558 start_codon:yes stop_codon:yes gene_type:complete